MFQTAKALHLRRPISFPCSSSRPSTTKLEPQQREKNLVRPSTSAKRTTATAAMPLSSTSTMMQALSAHWLAVSGVAVCTYLIFRILRFVRADADASLLSAKPPPPHAYRGKSVWITGASQGLGARLALEYYRHGAHVILSSRSEEKLRAVADAIVVAAAAGSSSSSSSPSSSSSSSPNPPPRPTVLPFDALAPFEELSRAASEAAEASKRAWNALSSSSSSSSSPSTSSPSPSSSLPSPPSPPRLALLVLCAGASQHAAAAATTAEVSDAILELNAAAPIRLTRAALPHLLETAAAALRAREEEQGEEEGNKRKKSTTTTTTTATTPPPAASVLGVASMAALVPSPGQAAYSASKAALALYLRSVEAELYDKGFRATVVYPGPLAAASASASGGGGGGGAGTNDNNNGDDGDKSSPSSSPSISSIFSTTAVRTVYGSTGLKQEGAEAVSSKRDEDNKRLAAERASALIVAAGYNGLGEALLGKNPVLLLGHLARGSLGGPSRALPQRLLRKILSRVGPARAAALEEGKGGYDAGALLSSSAAAAGSKKQA